MDENEKKNEEIYRIEKDGKLYAIIIDTLLDVPGIRFYTPANLYIQIGQWLYNKGHYSTPHIHLYRERLCTITQEAIYVLRGSLQIFIYDRQLNLIAKEKLASGGIAVLVDGGHYYEILEDDTKVLEFKNGPFASPDEDRKQFDQNRRRII